jgi:signal transduction histidine kinase
LLSFSIVATDMGEYLFIGSAVLSLANGTVLLCVNPRRMANRAFFASSLCITAWCFCVIMAMEIGADEPLDLRSLLFWLRASSAVGAFLVWFIWLMRSVLLQEGTSTRMVLVRSWPWFSASCLIATIAFSEFFISSASTPKNTIRGIGYGVYAVSILTFCIWLLVDSFHRARQLSGAHRIEMLFFVITAICSCVLVILSHAASLVVDTPWLRHSSPVWFSVLHGIAVWAVCYHKVFDAKQVIFSVGQRLVLFGLLAGAAVGLSLLLNGLIPLTWSVFLATIVSCAIAAALDKPSRRLVGLDPELILQEPRRTIIQWARQYADENQLRASFEKLLREWSQTDRVALIPFYDKAHLPSGFEPPSDWDDLITLSKDGWLTPESLQRKRSVPETTSSVAFMYRNNLGALLSVPRGDPHPSLLVALGQKVSLRPYTFPDIQILLALSELMDNILTHTRAAADAAQLRRLETAAMMSRGLAHDLSNLATPVSSFLLHMETRVDPGAPEAAVLADAKHSIGVMQQYIQESLFFTRTLVLKIESIAAHSLLMSVSRLSHERAKQQNVEIVIKSDQGFTFFADPSLVQRLLQNLTFNAVDASRANGKVELLASATNDGRTFLEVRDYGTGIAPEIIDHIFEPYFTTKESGRTLRGLGLGLAICHKIVDLHGGNIGVVSDVGQGTTFTITLPAKPSPPLAPPKSGQIESAIDPVILRQRPLLI